MEQKYFSEDNPESFGLLLILADQIPEAFTAEDIMKFGGPSVVAQDVVAGYYALKDQGFPPELADSRSLMAFVQSLSPEEIDSDPGLFDGLVRLGFQHNMYEYLRNTRQLGPVETKSAMIEFFTIRFKKTGAESN